MQNWTQNEKLQAISSVIRSIPYGEVSSYGKVAQQAGLPGHARYVAYFLKHYAAQANLPWHRIVKSNNTIAFPSCDPRHQEQIGLLRAEGWHISDKNRLCKAPRQKCK
ncbi:MAG: MGMT family protein [Oleiphilaceae bacterium]|nr:MGMT family protein [Oleiphilaceae bacterium]